MSSKLSNRPIRSDYRIQLKVIKQLYDWLDTCYKEINPTLSLKNELKTFSEQAVERRLAYCILNEKDKKGVTVQDKILNDIGSNIPGIKDLKIDYLRRIASQPFNEVDDDFPPAGVIAIDLFSYISDKVILTYRSAIEDILSHSSIYDLFKNTGITNKQLISIVSCINIAIHFIQKEMPNLILAMQNVEVNSINNLNNRRKQSTVSNELFTSTLDIVGYVNFWSSRYILSLMAKHMQCRATYKTNRNEAASFLKELSQSELMFLIACEHLNIAEHIILRQASISLQKLISIVENEPVTKYKYIKITLSHSHTKMLRLIKSKYDISATKNTNIYHSEALAFGGELVYPIGLLPELSDLLFFDKQVTSILDGLKLSVDSEFDMFDKIADIFNYQRKNSTNELLRALRTLKT
ncbi:MAG TPA: hypothetical protein VIM93_00255 [Kangiella sp.]